MSWPSRIATAAGRGAVRLVPAGRRDWAEAVWAEAHEVPAGWPRLAWRAGGLGLIAKEGQMARTIGSWSLFVVAAGAAAWGAWPGPPVSHAAAVQGGIIITLALLVGLPLLSRWLLGSPGNRTARWLRAVFYAAILAVMPAQTAIRLFLGTVPRSGIDRHTFDVIQGPGVPGSVSGSSGWAGEIGILFFTACLLAVLLALTARRTPVAPATLAIGAGAGLVTVLGAGTTALMVRAAWVRHLLYHGPHLTASAVYGRELYASQDVSAYLLLLFGFPIIGLIMGLVGTGVANLNPRLPDGGRPGGPPGPGGPGPQPAPPDGGRQVDTEELNVLAGGADAGPTAPKPVLAHH